jgi:hypothetical protein
MRTAAGGFPAAGFVHATKENIDYLRSSARPFTVQIEPPFGAKPGVGLFNPAYLSNSQDLKK